MCDVAAASGFVSQVLHPTPYIPLRQITILEQRQRDQ